MSNQAQTKIVLLRPRPIHDESWYGYLARVSEMNGFQSAQFLPIIYTSRIALQEALKLSDDELERLQGPLPESYRLGEYLDKRSTYNCKYLRWCPKCIEKHDYHKNIWSLRFSCVCIIHGLRLHDRCPQCNKLQHLKRFRLFHCENCGADLKQSKHIKIDKSVHRLQEQIINTFIGVFNQSSFNLDYQNLNKLVFYIGQFNHINIPHKPGKFVGMNQLDYVYPLLITTAKLLDNWPKPLHDLIHNIYLQSPVKLSIRKHFGTLYYVLYSTLRSPKFDFLRDAFENYLNKYWPAQITNRNRAFKISTISRHPRFTLKQVSEITGVEPSVINHIVNSQKIKVDVIKLTSGREVRLFHKALINQLKCFEYQTKTLQETALILQLSEERVRNLIDSNILTLLVSKKYKPAKWQIQQRSIEKLCFFSAMIESGCVPFKQVLKNWKLTMNEFLAFTEALMKHEMTVYSEIGGVVSIGNTWLKKETFRNWLEQYREENNNTFSIDEAARQLKLKQQVVYHLVKVGLISSLKTKRAGKKITKEAIIKFNQQYVALSALAKHKHVSPSALLKTLNIKPVTGRQVDGGRQYFYLKKHFSI